MADDASDMQSMASAPRDGTLIRLWLRAGGSFIGYYSDKWHGWVDHNDPCPLIRGDFCFLGREPVDHAEWLNEPMRKAGRRTGPPKVAQVIR